MRAVVVDTNVIVTWLTDPSTDLEAQKQDKIATLMNQIFDNQVVAIFPEVVLHETCHVLTGPRFPETQIDELCASLRHLLEWVGWSFEHRDREIFIRALEILEQHPTLGLADSVIAARAEILGAELATFDKRLAANFNGTLWSEN
jgi:predicted nucleic acid-binding protein